VANDKRAEGARLAAELVAETMEWFDADNAKPMVNECVKMSRNLIKSLLKENLTDVKAKDKSQMLAYVGKTLDQVARFIQFSAGKPDQRTEVTVATLLANLSDSEMEVFDKALARIEATGAKTPSALH
jgi:hypothetical protein